MLTCPPVRAGDDDDLLLLSSSHHIIGTLLFIMTMLLFDDRMATIFISMEDIIVQAGSQYCFSALFVNNASRQSSRPMV
jgi:hypothetical protein